LELRGGPRPPPSENYRCLHTAYAFRYSLMPIIGVHWIGLSIS
jgi:hypothetical protein